MLAGHQVPKTIPHLLMWWTKKTWMIIKRLLLRAEQVIC